MKIPASVNGKKVKDVSLKRFEHYHLTCFTDVEEVIFEKGISSISSRSLIGFLGLLKVTLPESVTSIGSEAFGLGASLCVEPRSNLTLYFPNGKNDSLEIPEDKWLANKIIIEGEEYNP